MSPTSFLYESDPSPHDEPVDPRPEAKNLWHRLSRTTRARVPSQIKGNYKYFQIPGIGQIAGGLPNPFYFPFDTLEAKVARPDRWEPTPNRPVEPPSLLSSLQSLSLAHGAAHPTSAGVRATPPHQQPQDTLVVPFASEQANPLKKVDVTTALQYGTAQGYPPLYYFLRQFTRDHLHPNCPYKGGPEIILTCGNTDGLAKALMAFSNEWSEEKDWIRDREAILVEEFAFMSAVQQAQPRGLNIAAVAMDDEGMLAEGPRGLRDVLENWDLSKGKRPHLMYTVTMGQNPTSGVLSLARRREIYALCSKYDIIIIEDDPYWYLQFPSATSVNTTTTSDPSNLSFNPDCPMFANAEPRPAEWKSSGYDFLDSLVPSYINVDTDGRVVRLDTFSKTVAPGCRLGWITAQPAVIERLLCITESTTQQPSGFVQATVAELLLGPDHHGIDGAPIPSLAAQQKASKGGKGGLRDGQGWKADGWVRWLEGLRGNYERRMNQMSRILDTNKFLVKSGRRQSLDANINHTQNDNDDDEDDDNNDGWAVVERTQMLDFHWPLGGMFLWLRICFEHHPLYRTYRRADGLAGVARLSHALWLFWTSAPYRVLVAPGATFSPTPEMRDREGWKYMRLCFAAVHDDEVEPVTQRLVDGLAAFWRIKDRNVIEKILEEEQKATGDQERSNLTQMMYMVGPC